MLIPILNTASQPYAAKMLVLELVELQATFVVVKLEAYSIR